MKETGKINIDLSQEITLDDLLKGIRTFREKKLLEDFFTPKINYLKSNGVSLNKAVLFCDILKKPFSSKGRRKSKRVKNNEKINKADILELLTKLYSEIGEKINSRDFNRCNYWLKSILLAYVAAKRPDVMHQIANDHFNGLRIQTKYANIFEVIEPWNQIVDDIEKFKNNHISLQPSSFINDDSFLYEFHSDDDCDDNQDLFDIESIYF